VDSEHDQECENRMCTSACGRPKFVGPDGQHFDTCCKSCEFLFRTQRIIGHDVECDIWHNGGVSPPWYWRSSTRWPDDFHDEVGGEYVKNMGTKLIQRRLPTRQVMKGERIEDARLWSIYVWKRGKIRERGTTVVEDVKPETMENVAFSARTTLDRTVNEVWLLHGTSEEAAKAIAKSNFSCSSGGCFGSGAYFADDSAKANQYAKGYTDDGCKIMLLCRVTLGNIKKLPKGQDRDAERFAKDPSVDAVLGFTDSREFVVYDMAQIYPEYMMHYKEMVAE